jgi:hypothetical protein
MGLVERQIFIGILLEKQIDSLNSSRKKPRIQAVMLAIMEEALNMYTEDAAPLHRARILIKKLELMHVMPAEHGNNEPNTVFVSLQELMSVKVSLIILH